MSLLFDLRKPYDAAVSSLRWYAGKFGTMALFATAQALLVSILAAFLVKSTFGNGFSLVVFSIFVSLVFLTIVFALTVLAGNIGRFLAFVFLVLQMSTTGASLPVQMLPEGLHTLSNYLPLTYSINGFKAVITLDNYSSLWSSVFALFIFLAVFLIIASIVVMIKASSSSRPSTVE